MMILGDNEGNEYSMTDGSSLQHQQQFNNDCYADLAYETRQLRNIDLNNNINQLNCNQNIHPRQLNQQQTNQQFSETNHLNLVQFVDQFNSNGFANGNQLIANLSNQSQQQNLVNNQQLFCSDQQAINKDVNLPLNLGNNGQIKIKTENAIDLSNNLSNNLTNNLSNNLSNNLTNNLSTNVQNSTNLSNNLMNLSSSESLSNVNIPLITNSINLNSINLTSCDNEVNKFANNSTSNLPVNFNDLLLNDYQLNGNQHLNTDLVIASETKCSHANNLDQSDKINSNNELSPIDMENQERIKLERKRLRNRLAASKCRRKKMETLNNLEELVRQLKNENSNLVRLVQDLKEMNYQLKQEVIEHIKKGCNIKNHQLVKL